MPHAEVVAVRGDITTQDIDAVDAAVTTLQTTTTQAREARIVAYNDGTHRAVLSRLEGD